MTEHIWFMDGHCETDIVHYGVKGMRWGIRKRNEPANTLSSIRRVPPESYFNALTKCNAYNAEIGYPKNTANSAIALAMRARGYDVTATRDEEPRGRKELAQCFKDGHFKSFNIDGRYHERSSQWLYNSVVDTLRKDGGSEGIIYTKLDRYFYSKGYAINYSCKNGVVKFYDAQSHTDARDMKDWISTDLLNPLTMTFMRTDDKELTDYATTFVREEDDDD